MSIASRLRMKLSKVKSPAASRILNTMAVCNPSMALFSRGESSSYVCNDGFEHQMDGRLKNMTVTCLSCRDSRTWEYAPTLYDRASGTFASDERNAIEHIMWEAEHRRLCTLPRL